MTSASTVSFQHRVVGKASADRRAIDHIVHSKLTIWALRASPETIQLQYKREDKRQQPALPRDEAKIKTFYSKKEFMKHMYQEEQYLNIAFLQREIDEK